MTKLLLSGLRGVGSSLLGAIIIPALCGLLFLSIYIPVIYADWVWNARPAGFLTVPPVAIVVLLIIGACSQERP